MKYVAMHSEFFGIITWLSCRDAGMVYSLVSKTSGRKSMRVRLPLSAQEVYNLQYITK